MGSVGGIDYLTGMNSACSPRFFELGVGGLSLGGGYSWKSNQFGLTIDTIISFELALPSGDQLLVTNSSNPDLFFGLKVSVFAPRLSENDSLTATLISIGWAQ